MADLSRLWAPWRKRYVSHRGVRRCIFCPARRSKADRRRYVIARGERVFAVLNRYPYNNGHLMIAPYRHVGRAESLTLSEWTEIFRMSLRLMARLSQTLHPHGFNIGMNLGRVGGAGFPGHLHLHIVPRWDGDTNFMPILGNTKVISQSLDELYTLFRGRAS